jgi:hypothetical protein
MKRNALIGFLLVSAACCTTAGAQEYARLSNARNQQVRVYGMSTDAEAEQTRGFGNEVPLGKAIAAIIPRGYVLRTSGVDQWWLDQPVSWNGGRDWTEALRDALAPYPELAADVSRSSRIVLLRVRGHDAGATEPRPMSEPAPARAPRYSAERRDERGGDDRRGYRRGYGRDDGRDGYGYRGMARAADTWDIRASDKTLQRALSRWAESAGWQLSWELPVDYPVDERASIGASFEGAVEAVVGSMVKAEVPMKAIFYKGNHVLRIVAKGVE